MCFLTTFAFKIHHQQYMSKIKIEGMQFYAYHGCFTEETLVGTHFRVDCSMNVDIREAALSGDLKKTVNYQAVYQCIAKEMAQPAALLEEVAYRILKRLHADFPILQRSWISVQKMNPPIGGKASKVAVEMSSDELTMENELKKVES
jgi:dihydroneopterin aldolase